MKKMSFAPSIHRPPLSYDGEAGNENSKKQNRARNETRVREHQDRRCDHAKTDAGAGLHDGAQKHGSQCKNEWVPAVQQEKFGHQGSLLRTI